MAIARFYGIDSFFFLYYKSLGDVFLFSIIFIIFKENSYLRECCLILQPRSSEYKWCSLHNSRKYL